MQSEFVQQPNSQKQKEIIFSLVVVMLGWQSETSLGGKFGFPKELSITSIQKIYSIYCKS